MRVLSRFQLDAFVKNFEGREEHRELKTSIDRLLRELAREKWSDVGEVRFDTFSCEYMTANQIAVELPFHHRLVLAVNFENKEIEVRWVGRRTRRGRPCCDGGRRHHLDMLRWGVSGQRSAEPFGVPSAAIAFAIASASAVVR